MPGTAPDPIPETTDTLPAAPAGDKAGRPGKGPGAAKVPPASRVLGHGALAQAWPQARRRHGAAPADAL
ncbi:hypothetical protein ACU4GD_35475 [Cupriavidus basilensis]